MIAEKNRGETTGITTWIFVLLCAGLSSKPADLAGLASTNPGLGSANGNSPNTFPLNDLKKRRGNYGLPIADCRLPIAEKSIDQGISHHFEAAGLKPQVPVTHNNVRRIYGDNGRRGLTTSSKCSVVIQRDTDLLRSFHF